jgi:hypothetical protein
MILTCCRFSWIWTNLLASFHLLSLMFFSYFLWGINPSVGIWCYDLYHHWASIRSSRSRQTEKPKFIQFDDCWRQPSSGWDDLLWCFHMNLSLLSKDKIWFSKFLVIQLLWDHLLSCMIDLKKIYLLSYFLVVKKQLSDVNLTQVFWRSKFLMKLWCTKI